MMEDGEPDDEAERPQSYSSALITVDRIVADIAGLLLVGMMFLVVASCLRRFVLGVDIPDVVGVSEMLLVGVVILPLACVQLLRGHIEVTVFTGSASPRTLAWLTILGLAVGLVAVSILAYTQLRGAYYAWQTNDIYYGVNRIPIWPARLAFAIGVSLLAFRLLMDLVAVLRRGDTRR